MLTPFMKKAQSKLEGTLKSRCASFKNQRWLICIVFQTAAESNLFVLLNDMRMTAFSTRGLLQKDRTASINTSV